MKFNINTPIWKNKSVGIKRENITEDIEVEISYTDKQGNKVFPHIYLMTKEKALSYPTKTFGNTPKLQIIPIADFDIKVFITLTPDEQKKKDYYETMGLILN